MGSFIFIPALSSQSIVVATEEELVDENVESENPDDAATGRGKGDVCSCQIDPDGCMLLILSSLNPSMKLGT